MSTYNYKHLGKITVPEILALAGNDVPANLQETIERLKQGKTIPSRAHAQLLDDWIDAQKQAANAAPPVKPDDSQQKYEEHQRQEQQKIADQTKRIEGKNAAVARLGQWQQSGLLDTPRNHAAVEKFLAEAPELSEWRAGERILSAVIIDCAVKHLHQRGELDWKPAEQPAPEKPKPVILSDQTEQLPLGTTPTFRHSKAQLADLAKREAAAKSVNRHGWHGSGRI